MAWGKGKTEKEQGGKPRHSNRDGWGFHDKEKLALSIISVAKTHVDSEIKWRAGF